MKAPIVAPIAVTVLPFDASAGAEETVVRQIEVGGQTRSYALDRHEATGAPGLLPIIVFLPGIGTHLGERIPSRFDLPPAACRA